MGIGSTIRRRVNSILGKGKAAIANRSAILDSACTPVVELLENRRLFTWTTVVPLLQLDTHWSPGPYGSDTTSTLTLTGLPAHSQIKVYASVYNYFHADTTIDGDVDGMDMDFLGGGPSGYIWYCTETFAHTASTAVLSITGEGWDSDEWEIEEGNIQIFTEPAPSDNLTGFLTSPIIFEGQQGVVSFGGMSDGITAWDAESSPSGVTYSFDWDGDLATLEQPPSTSPVAILPATLTDDNDDGDTNGDITVHGKFTLPDGRFSPWFETKLHIANVAPTLALPTIDPSSTLPPSTASPTQGATVGVEKNFLLNFSDSGVDDTFSATIDWGDGTAGPVDGSDIDVVAGTISTSHTYTTPGRRTVSVVLTDDDGGSTTISIEMIVNRDLNGPGLLGWWKFDETSGITASDATGHEHDGTLQAGGSWSTEGYWDGGLAVTDSAEGFRASSVDLGGATAFSVAFWIKPNDLADYTQRVGAVNEWGAFYFHSAANGAIYVGTDYDPLEEVDNRIATSEGIMTENEWQHFAFTFQDGVGKLFRNGVKIAEHAGMQTPSSWGGLILSQIAGSVDDLRVYNYSLSPENVKAVQSGLIAAWKFDQSSDQFLEDASGNKNDSVLKNGTQWTQGYAGGGLSFDGVDDEMYAPTIDLKGATSFSVAFWILPTRLTTNTQAISAGTGAFDIHSTADGSVYVGTDVTHRIHTGSDLMKVGEWQHFAFTFNNGTGRLYKDGVQVGTDANNMTAPMAWDGLRIYFMGGTIDDLRLYSVAKSQSQIEDIRAAADAYRGTVDAFSKVYNEVKYEPYFGSMKDEESVWETKAGNDWDQAALLQSRLPVGVTSELRQGAITLSDAAAMDLLGTDSSKASKDILFWSGVAAGAVLTFNHVWLQVALPDGDGGFETSIALDPSLKKLERRPGIAAFGDKIFSSDDGVPFDVAQQDAYLDSGSTDLPIQYWLDEVAAKVKQLDPAKSLADVSRIGNIQRKSFQSLADAQVAPADLGVALASGTSVALYDEAHTVTIALKNSSDATVLVGTWNVRDIAKYSISLSYVPDGADLTPHLYLRDGNTVYDPPATDNIASGSDVTLVLSFTNHVAVMPTPEVREIFSPREFKREAGEILGIGISASQFSNDHLFSLQTALTNSATTATAASPGSYPQLLNHFIAAKYLAELQEVENIVADYAYLSQSKNIVTGGIVTSGTVFQSDSELQNPIYDKNTSVDFPLSWLIQSRKFPLGDAAGIPDPNGSYGSPELQAAMRLIGLTGSALEHHVLESVLNVESVSTVKGLQHAALSGIDSGIYDLETPPSSGALSALTIAQRNAIQTAITAGKKVTVAKEQVHIGNWSGAVWIEDFLVVQTNYQKAELGYVIMGSADSKPKYGASGTGNANSTTTRSATPRSATTFGDPIAPAQGNMLHDEQDFSLPAIGLPLEFSRHYDSLIDDDWAPLGKGWRHSYSDYLEFKNDSGPGSPVDYDTVVWHTSKGLKHEFRNLGFDTFAIPPELHGTFTHQAGGFQYAEDNGLTYSFDGIGRVASINDRNENRLDMEYYDSESHELTKVRSNSPDSSVPARRIEIFYTDHSTINAVIVYNEPSGPERIWYYYVNAETLEWVRGPDASPDNQRLGTNYTYFTGDSREGLLHTISSVVQSDYGGTTVTGMHTYDYYPNRRGLSHTDAEGKTEYFSYDLFHNTTTYVDSNGNKLEYQYGTRTQSPKLMAKWSFEDQINEGDSDYTDSSGRGNNGMLDTPTSTHPLSVGGPFGQALSFDGTQYIRVEDNDDIQRAADMSFSFWVMPTQFGGPKGILSKGNVEAGPRSYQIYFSDDVLRVGINGAGVDDYHIFETSNAFTVGKWYHIVAAYDDAAASAGRLKLYVNRVEWSVSEVSTLGVGSSSAPLLIGKIEEEESDSGLIGLLDEVRIYHHTLTDAEALELYSDTERVIFADQTRRTTIRQASVVKKTIDELGWEESFTYDDFGNIIQHVTKDGDITNYTFNYDATTERPQNFNQPVMITEPGDRQTLFGYDLSNGDLLSRQDAAGNVTTWTYPENSVGLPTTMTAPEENADGRVRNHTTVYTYNDAGQVITTTTGLPSAWWGFNEPYNLGNDYTANGNFGTISGATSATEDGRAALELNYGDSFELADFEPRDGVHFSVSLWLKPLTLTTYDNYIGATNEWGAFMFHTDSAGGIWVGTTNTSTGQFSSSEAGTVTLDEWQHFRFTYDNKNAWFYKNGVLIAHRENMDLPTEAWGGLLVHNTDGFLDDLRIEGATTTNEYDGRGFLQSTTDAEGRETTYTTNVLGQVLTTDLPYTWIDGGYNRRTTNTYFNGQLQSTRDAYSRGTDYVYDKMGRAVRATANGDKSETRSEYDAVGNLIASTDANGNTTRFIYDSRNRSIATILPGGAMTRTRYDGAGRVVESIDPLGNSTKKFYDSGDRVAMVVDPIGQRTINIYDPTTHFLTKQQSFWADAHWTFDGIASPTDLDAEDVTSHGLTGSRSSTGTSWVVDEGHEALQIGAGGSFTAADVEPSNPNKFSLSFWMKPTALAPAGNFNNYIGAENVWGAFFFIMDEDGGVYAGIDETSTGRFTPTDLPAGSIPLNEWHEYRFTYDNHIACFYRDNFLLATKDDMDAPSEAWDGLIINNANAMFDDIRLDEGSSTAFFNDALGRVTETHGNDGQVTLTTYTANGQIDRTGAIKTEGLTFDDTTSLMSYLTDATVSRVTQYIYNEHGNRWLTIHSDGATDQTIYDSTGRAIFASDALGRATGFGYDSAGMLRYEYLPSPDGVTPGATIYHEYNAADQPTKLRNENGHDTTFEYDNRGNLFRTTNAANDYTEVYYDPSGKPVKTVDELGRATLTGYDARGRVAFSQSADPDGTGPRSAAIAVSEYDAAGNLIKTVAPNGAIRTFSYDTLNRLVETVAPDPTTGAATGAVTRQAYDGNQLWRETDAAGKVTQYEYDGSGRLKRQWLTTTPDSTGQVPTSTPFSTTDYNSLNEVVQQTNMRVLEDPDPAIVTEFVYDKMGRVTKSTLDPSGEAITTANGYDAVGNLIWTVDPIGMSDDPNETTLAARVAANFHTTTFTYDRLNRQTSITLADPDHVFTTSGISNGTKVAPVTEYEYFAGGQLKKRTDASGNETSYAYDSLERLSTEETTAQKVSYAYDAASNVTSITTDIPTGPSAKKQTRQFDYDSLNNVVEERWLNKDDQVVRSSFYNYDINGSLLNESDPDSAYNYTYDFLDRLVYSNNFGTPGIWGISKTFAYDSRNLRTQLERTLHLAGGVNVNEAAESYTYDNAGRLTGISQQSSTRSGSNVTVPTKGVAYSYRNDGQLEQVHRYAGASAVTTTGYGYDTAGRLTSMLHEGPTGTDLINLSWTLDDAGWVQTIVGPANTATYTYDANGQVLNVDNTGLPDEEYDFDATGNRVGDGYDTAVNNRQTEGDGYTYEYDYKGNRTRRSREDDPSTTTVDETEIVRYIWDYENRLTDVAIFSVTGTGASEKLRLNKRLHYRYDLEGNKIERSLDKDTDGAATGSIVEGVYNESQAYAYDGSELKLVFNLISAGYSIIERYFDGQDVDEVVAVDKVTGGSTTGTNWLLQDQQQSVRGITNSSGALQAGTNYDAFGNAFEYNGSWGAATSSTPTTRLKYTGKELDADTGLYDYSARWYDATAGRFISEDPAGFGAGDDNLYRYIGNSTPNATDPTGLGAVSNDKDGVIDSAARLIATFGPTNARVSSSDSFFAGPPHVSLSSETFEQSIARLTAQQSRSTRLGPFGSLFPAYAQMIGTTPPAGYTEFVHSAVAPLIEYSPVLVASSPLLLFMEDGPAGGAWSFGKQAAIGFAEVQWAGPQGGFERGDAAYYGRNAGRALGVFASGLEVLGGGLFAGGSIIASGPTLGLSLAGAAGGVALAGVGLNGIRNFADLHDLPSWDVLEKNGSYEIKFKSGKAYAGKGSPQRAVDSAKEKMKKFGDPPVEMTYDPATSEREAFIEESRKQDKLGGVDSPNNYNIRKSPGYRMRIEDGD